MKLVFSMLLKILFQCLTRCRPSKGRRCIPDVIIWCMLRPTCMLISVLRDNSKYESNSISNFFEKKKNQFFGFPCCSTREDLSIDVSITNVGLILTKLWWFLFSGYRQTRFWNPHMETCRHTKNFNSKLKISG